MLRKIVASALVLATVAGASLATTGTAEARYWHRGYGGWHHGYGGGAIVGGLAAGLVGGVLLGGALASHNDYYDDGYYGYPGPGYGYAGPAYAGPGYGCRVELQRVPNQYNGGWHTERMRVCY